MSGADPVSPFPIRSPALEDPGPTSPLRSLHRAEANPTALKVILGSNLRRFREEAGFKQTEVCGLLNFSASKLCRLESGSQGCDPSDARALLALYQRESPTYVDEFMRLLELSHRSDWWKSWRDVVKVFFSHLLALEGAADLIRIYEPAYVPGLLQTPAYSEAVIRAEWPSRSTVDVKRTVGLRMERQRQLDTADAPTLWVVIKEDALLWSVADEQVMRDQIRHLIDCAQRPNVILQIAPCDVLRKVPITTNVTYLKFAQGELANAVYSEQLANSVFSQDLREVEHYLTLLDRLAAQVRTPEESTQWLKDHCR